MRDNIKDFTEIQKDDYINCFPLINKMGNLVMKENQVCPTGLSPHEPVLAMTDDYAISLLSKLLLKIYSMSVRPRVRF